MAQNGFAGDKKAPMRSPLAKVERQFIDRYVGKFPSWIETYHLTMTTVLWSLGVLYSGYRAGTGSLHWLWLSSLMLVLQWFTDAFDGSLGKHRDTGLVKWGYYMDHFLDFIFMSALLVGYTFLLEGADKSIMIILIPLIGAFWVNAFLSFSVTNEFEITQMGLGPTEIRILFVLLNTAIIFRGPSVLVHLLRPLLVLALFCLCIIVYKTHKRIWRIDMAEKRGRGTADREGDHQG